MYKKSQALTSKICSDINKGNVAECNSITSEKFTEIWKREYGSKELTPTIYSIYVAILNTIILPYFSKFKLDKIKTPAIIKFYDMLENDT